MPDGGANRREVLDPRRYGRRVRSIVAKIPMGRTLGAASGCGQADVHVASRPVGRTDLPLTERTGATPRRSRRPGAVAVVDVAVGSRGPSVREEQMDPLTEEPDRLPGMTQVGYRR